MFAFVNTFANPCGSDVDMFHAQSEETDFKLIRCRQQILSAACYFAKTNLEIAKVSLVVLFKMMFTFENSESIPFWPQIKVHIYHELMRFNNVVYE